MINCSVFAHSGKHDVRSRQRGGVELLIATRKTLHWYVYAQPYVAVVSLDFGNAKNSAPTPTAFVYNTVYYYVVLTVVKWSRLWKDVTHTAV